MAWEHKMYVLRRLRTYALAGLLLLGSLAPLAVALRRRR